MVLVRTTFKNCSWGIKVLSSRVQPLEPGYCLFPDIVCGAESAPSMRSGLRIPSTLCRWLWTGTLVVALLPAAPARSPYLLMAPVASGYSAAAAAEESQALLQSLQNWLL